MNRQPQRKVERTNDTRESSGTKDEKSLLLEVSGKVSQKRKYLG